MAESMSPQDLSKLIGSIYDCALDQLCWEHALTGVKDALDCHTAILHLNDTQFNRVLVHKSVGIDPYWLAQAQHHAAEMHSLLPLSPDLDEPYVLSRQVSPDRLDVSPFVQTYVKPQGLTDIMQLFLIHTPTRFAGLGIGRHQRRGLISDREIEFARLLLPHLQRAMTINNVLDARTIELARMSETLDTLRCGVLLTDARCRILGANSAAEEMLREASLVQASGGTLHGTTSSATAELQHAITLAARNTLDLGKMGLAVRLSETGTPPAFAHVLPLTGSALRTRLQPDIVTAVFISTAPDWQDGAAALAAAFNLTPTETRVLASLLAGRTLAETASALAIAPTTAKTHLDNIFGKTGVSRQAELIRLGASLARPTRSSD